MTDSYSASGIDQVEQLVSEQYLAVRMKFGQRNPAFTSTQTAVSHFTVGHMFYDMNADMDAEPLNAIGIVHPLAGMATYRTLGEERTWGPGDLCLHADPTHAFTATFDHLDCDFAIIDPTLLNDVARPVPGDPSPVRLTEYAPISDRAADQWMATFEFVRDTAAEPDLGPLVLGSIGRLLAASTLATFPSNALLDPTIEDRHDAHPATLRRALAFIETKLDQDVTVVDIARAAQVTPRALQLAFRRHLDTTPMAHLRRVRLDSAHRDLLAGTPSTATVTGIAMRWGFADASRFARQYRDTYGNAPSDTLQR